MNTTLPVNENHAPDLSRLERMLSLNPELRPVFDAFIVNVAAGIVQWLRAKDANEQPENTDQVGGTKITESA